MSFKPLRIVLLAAATICVGSCVLSVSPLHKPGQYTEGDGSNKSPMPANPQEIHVDKERLERCRALVQPVSDKDKKPKAPDIQPADLADKDKVIQRLIDYSNKQDSYISNHAKREQTRYDNWKDTCKGLPVM